MKTDPAQVARDLRAYLDYLLWDPAAMFKLLRTHTRGPHDHCVQRCGPWPCIAHRTAVHAERIYQARLVKLVSPIDDADSPFQAAIHANAIETTTPMRAVPKTTTTAGTSGGTTPSRRK